MKIQMNKLKAYAVTALFIAAVILALWMVAEIVAGLDYKPKPVRAHGG